MQEGINIRGQASRAYDSDNPPPPPVGDAPPDAYHSKNTYGRGRRTRDLGREHDTYTPGRDFEHYRGRSRERDRESGRGRSHSPRRDDYGDRHDRERTSHRRRSRSTRHEDRLTPSKTLEDRMTYPNGVVPEGIIPREDREALRERDDDGHRHRQWDRSPSPRHEHRNERGWRDSKRGSRPRDRSRSPRHSDREDSQQTARYPQQDIDSYQPGRARAPTPSTAYPLRDYSNDIAEWYGKQRRQTAETQHLPQFRNGDGKVNAGAYGGTLYHDFGLCYSTFKTSHACEMGQACPWRHHPLSRREKDWIVDVGGEKGRDFLHLADASYSTPDIPVPGASMLEVMRKERRERDYRNNYGR